MAYNTTTIERTKTKVQGINFQVTVYEMKTTVFCDCCDTSATGTKRQLKNAGWTFGGGSEFCPEHNF